MSDTKPSFSLRRFQSFFALAIMVVALSVLSDNFLTVDNGWNILRQISVNLCLSIGMTLVILSGGIDLSVGAILGFAGAIAAGLLKNGVTLAVLGVRLEFTPTGAVVAGLVVGGAAGWFNGFAITRFTADTINFETKGRLHCRLLGRLFPSFGTYLIVQARRE